MKHILLTVISVIGLISLISLLGSTTALAQVGDLQESIEVARGADMPAELFEAGDDGFITRIINLLLFIVAIISIFMLIIGGLKFTLSGGDKAKTTAARNTILYAIVGLLIAFFSFAIIEVVVQAIAGGSGGGASSDGFEGIF